MSLPPPRLSLSMTKQDACYKLNMPVMIHLAIRHIVFWSCKNMTVSTYWPRYVGVVYITHVYKHMRVLCVYVCVICIYTYIDKRTYIHKRPLPHVSDMVHHQSPHVSATWSTINLCLNRKCPLYAKTTIPLPEQSIKWSADSNSCNCISLKL